MPAEPVLDEQAWGWRLRFRSGDRLLTFRDWFEGWQSSADFRTVWNQALADAPPERYRWEMPAVSKVGLDAKAECVVLPSGADRRRLERDVFEEHLAKAHGSVAVFLNLGGDADLVVPDGNPNDAACRDLAGFVRKGGSARQQALWEAAGEAILSRVAERVVWVNTAGGGVAWLHLRIDSRPKYYRHRPYRDESLEPLQRGGSED